MAKVTITIEDLPDGKVSIKADPSNELMLKIHTSGTELTSAQAYALFAMRMIREEAKTREPLGIIIPRLS